MPQAVSPHAAEQVEPEVGRSLRPLRCADVAILLVLNLDAPTVEHGIARTPGAFDQIPLGCVPIVTRRASQPGWTQSLFWYITQEVGWRVEVLDRRVERELDALAEDVRQRFLRIVELIEKHGLAAMHEPHVKHLDGKLWEMRMKGKGGIARAIYVTATGERVVVVHAFAKRTRKTPARALQTARARAKEVV